MPVLVDKQGRALAEDDVFLSGGHYYRLCTRTPAEWYGISCTAGYLRHLGPEQAAAVEYVGPYAGNEHLFACD